MVGILLFAVLVNKIPRKHLNKVTKLLKDEKKVNFNISIVECEAYQSQGVKTESQPEDVNAEPLIDVRAGEIVTAVFNGKLTKKNEFPFMVRYS